MNRHILQNLSEHRNVPTIAGLSFLAAVALAGCGDNNPSLQSRAVATFEARFLGGDGCLESTAYNPSKHAHMLSQADGDTQHGMLTVIPSKMSSLLTPILVFEVHQDGASINLSPANQGTSGVLAERHCSIAQ